MTPRRKTGKERLDKRKDRGCLITQSRLRNREYQSF